LIPDELDEGIKFQMYKGYKILAVIPARGGSKGVTRKNVRELNGKPLIAWTIGQAVQSRYVDRVIVSTEDAEIGEVARHAGAETPFIRPQSLATDTATGVDVLCHAVENAGSACDYVLLLQPTSPLRSVADIDDSISKCIDEQLSSVVSVSEATKSPYWMYHMSESGTLSSIIDETASNRQQLPRSYVPNGAVYVLKASTLLKNRKIINDDTRGYTMPSERSFDIDTELDFVICEFLKKRMDSNE
jgi:N-acylneuraminate cytidylyltransferase